MSLKGKVALVTGAGRGIGKAVALAFGREYCHVALNDVCPQEDLERVVLEVSALGVNASAVSADVSNYDEVAAMVKRTESALGSIDILVNNAGIIRRGSVETVTETEWDDVIRVNLKGTFNCCKVVADSMISRRRGKIVNVSSIVGKTGDITSAPGYGPSKAGIDALTKT